MGNKNTENHTLDLNKQLYEECVKEKVDFGKVEELLALGADPMG